MRKVVWLLHTKASKGRSNKKKDRAGLARVAGKEDGNSVLKQQ